MKPIRMFFVKPSHQGRWIGRIFLFSGMIFLFHHTFLMASVNFTSPALSEKKVQERAGYFISVHSRWDQERVALIQEQRSVLIQEAENF